MIKGMQEVIDVMTKAKADLDKNGGLKQRGAHSRIWQMKRATSPSWFRMMLAVVSPY